MKFFDELDCIRSVLSLASHTKFSRPAQNGLDTIPHDLVIIYEKDVEWHSGWKQLYPFPYYSRAPVPAGVPGLRLQTEHGRGRLYVRRRQYAKPANSPLSPK